MTESRLLNNRYHLLRRLGKGGMAVVYLAHDRILERQVAVKVLREDYSGDPAFQERFQQEARAAANLTHPNIVTVHDFGLDEGQLFIVMEYVPGADLNHLIRTRGRFTPEEALPLLVQACAGIGYAHRAGLVHCDVKPHNMLVTPDQRLKVTDFGIARALAAARPQASSDFVWGSPLYFAPEQAAGGPPLPASDVYSLGVVLYEMLTAEPLFSAATASEVALMHMQAPPPHLSAKLPDVPPAIEQILHKVLSKEPSARYRTADQLGRVLLNFGSVRDAPALALTPEAATALPAAVSAPEPGLNIDWVSVGLGLLALTAVGGLIPFWMWVYFVYNPPIW